MHVSFLIRRRKLTAWLKNSRVGNFLAGSGKTLLDRELFDNHDPFGIYFVLINLSFSFSISMLHTLMFNPFMTEAVII